MKKRWTPSRRLLFPGSVVLSRTGLTVLLGLNRGRISAGYPVKVLANWQAVNRELGVGMVRGLDEPRLEGLIRELRSPDDHVCENVKHGMAGLLDQWPINDSRRLEL